MEELGESELGTQEYWNKRYKEEIGNFTNHGDPGEIWFGEDSVQKIIDWMDNSEKVNKNSHILDLGCGNGMFLVDLANEGYKNLTGVDYSKEAIILAKAIAEKMNLNINYATCNIVECLEGKYDLVHDKGTYDAITLNAKAKEFRINYLENISRSIDANSIFIITSCNWTKEELNEQFKDYFMCVDTIPTPQFKFGGQTGHVFTSLVYQLKQ